MMETYVRIYLELHRIASSYDWLPMYLPDRQQLRPFPQEGQLSILLGLHEGLRFGIAIKPGPQLVSQSPDSVRLRAVVVDPVASLVVDLLVHYVGEAAALADYRGLRMISTFDIHVTRLLA